jgi:hypothetical protein
MMADPRGRGEGGGCRDGEGGKRQRGGGGRTLLDLAVILGRADIIQVLLEYGADANKPSRGRTPLETAAAFG